MVKLEKQLSQPRQMQKEQQTRREKKQLDQSQLKRNKERIANKAGVVLQLWLHFSLSE
jgi:hypothetical protein